MDPGLFPEFVNKPVAVFADISVIKSAIGSDGDPKNFENNPAGGGSLAGLGSRVLRAAGG